MGIAWRKALHFTATVKRNATTVTASGATKFAYTTLLTGVLCSVQNASGRMKQDDEAQIGGRKKSVLFGAEMLGVLKQNDLIVLESGDVGATYRLVNVHEVVDPNAPHVECQAEQYAPAGRD